MRKFIWRWPRRAYRRGQALAEYSIIVAIVAVASIAVLTVFGKQIRSLLFGSAKAISGDDSAQQGDETAGQEGTVQRDIDNW